MTIRDDLLREIEAFTQAFGLAETSVGSLALKDSRFVARLRAHGGASIRSVERVRAWLARESARRSLGDLRGQNDHADRGLRGCNSHADAGVVSPEPHHRIDDSGQAA